MVMDDIEKYVRDHSSPEAQLLHEQDEVFCTLAKDDCLMLE